MKAEFLKDDNGSIWFYYATGIQTRSRIKQFMIPGGMPEVKVAVKTEVEDKEEMLAEIDDYQEEASA